MTHPKPARSASLYSVHPSIAHAQAIIANLPEKTGKSIEEWIKLIKRPGPSNDQERRDWLKKEYKLGGTTAWLIVDHAAGNGAEDTDPETYLKAAAGYVEAMYVGKAGLWPIHNALVELGLSLGTDVKVCPCKTIVPLYRQHVFAQIKPSTVTRIDFGLALKDSKKSPSHRLVATGGLAKGDRITHCFALTSMKNIDAEIKEWVQIAYDLDE